MNRIALTTCAALVVALGAAAAGAADAQARGRPRRGNVNNDLVVTLVTPTIAQEVLPDLSDPGLNNVVTVRFSAPLRAADFISNTNVFNRLTPSVEFLNSTFDRLPGTPLVQGNVFRFDPRTPSNGGVLANGQYTLNIKSSVRSTRGKLLNQGASDFSATFTVGTDVFPPVLRKVSPIHNQTGIGLSQKIVATFNEPILNSSLLTTVVVNDVGTSPPTQIFGANGSTGISTDRNGFDVVFTPDPCFGYPPKSTIEFQMQGRPIGDPSSPVPACQPGNLPAVSAVTDLFNNQFTRDAGLWWVKNAATGLWDSPNGTFEDCTGLFKMQFQTRGIVPPPIGLNPGSSMWNRINPFCTAFATVWANSCDFVGRVFFYTTGTSLGEIDLTQIITLYNSQGISDFTRARVVANSPVRFGRPSGMMVDPRWDPTNGYHTFLYLVDQRSASVLVLDSRNMKVLGRFAGFTSPRDIGMSTDYNLPPTRVQMWVTDFGARQVIGIDLSSIAMNLGGQPGAASPCDAIKDNLKNRLTLQVGNGPTDVAGDCYLLNRAMVVNSLDNSVSLIDVARGTVLKDYETGGNPLSVDWTLFGYGFWDIAAIANQGGLTDPDGSISMYLRSPPILGFPAYRAVGAASPRDGIEATFTDGVKNPTYVWGVQEWANPNTGNSIPLAYFIPNTGGKTIQQITPRTTGVFGIQVDFNAVQTREVGFNPTGAMMDPYFPNQMIFACVAGEGRFVGMDPLRQTSPDGITVPGIRRIFSCYSH
jgi:hypothetical protein